MSDKTSNISRRFGGIARLYGDAGLATIQAAHICVIGIGGVGSWVAESLARSGIGELTLIDMDVVAESNINRQLVATTSSLGKDKIAVMAERIEQINPACRVNLVDEFINRDNIASLLSNEMDVVVDCIDDFRIKAALIAWCKREKINVVTTGGAGGQSDPSKIHVSDLSRTQHDKLLSKTRKLLRQDYGFARNPKRSFGVPCVYSDEQIVYPDGAGGITNQRPQHEDNATDQTLSALSCAGGMGSITHITASFAMFASATVLNQLVAGC